MIAESAPAALPAWLPGCVLRRLQDRPGVVRVISMVGWAMTERIVRGVSVLLFGIWMARILGPADYGLLGWGVALAGFAGVAASLGLDAVVVRALVRRPEEANVIIGSAAMLKCAGAMLGLAAACTAALLMRPASPLAWAVAAVLAAGALFQVGDVADFSFQARQRGRPIALARICAAVISAVLRIALLIAGADVLAFAYAATFEVAVAALLLIAAARRSGMGPAQWRTSRSEMVGLLGQSWPLAISGVALVGYMRLDQLLLAAMRDDHELGIYVAVVRMTEVWYVLPMMAASAAYPQLVRVFSRDRQRFDQVMSRMYLLFGLSALLLSLVLWSCSHGLVGMLYGAAYREAGGVLAIYAWAAIPAFLGVASDRYLLSVGDTRTMLLRTIIGLASSISLNLLLIPSFGARGAAWACVVSYGLWVISIGCFRDHRGQLSAMMDGCMTLMSRCARGIRRLLRGTRG